MKPVPPDHWNRPSAPARRRWLLAGGGVLMVAGMSALPFWGDFPPSGLPQQPPHRVASHVSPERWAANFVPQQPSHRVRSHGSPECRAENSDSPGETARSSVREIQWSEEEKERIRIQAQTAPPAFSAWATTLPPGANRRFALETAALAWGAVDPSSAADWARDLAGEAERLQAITHIACEAVRSDPYLALDLASFLPESSIGEIVPRAASEWAVTDPAAAADWASRISDASLRAVVLAGIATTWSERDAVAAATMLLHELPAGRLQADAIVSIVQRWARQSPGDAAAWVNQFPDGDLRAAAMECLGQAVTGNR